jgi:hypothetical protein
LALSVPEATAGAPPDPWGARRRLAELKGADRDAVPVSRDRF